MGKTNWRLVSIGSISVNKETNINLNFDDTEIMSGIAGPDTYKFKYQAKDDDIWFTGLDYMTAEKMNTDNMSRFLVQVSETHKQDFMVMVLDGASSHKCKELKVPGNIALMFLPPYSPELNPAEQIWNTLRRGYFANRVFDSTQQLSRLKVGWHV